MEDLRLCFVKLIGQNTENENVYEFSFTDNIDESWGVGYEYTPSCLCNDIIPNADNVVVIKQIITKITFGLVQDNCCFSMQDCIDKIIALAWEDISGYDEYPEDGRIVFEFGASYEDVENVLNNREISFEPEKSDE